MQDDHLMDDYPRWFVATVISLTGVLALTLAIASLMVVSALTRGPYHKPPPGPGPPCGHSGVKQVIQGNADAAWIVSVICNNGSINQR